MENEGLIRRLKEKGVRGVQVCLQPKGRRLIAERITARAAPLESFMAAVTANPPVRVSGTAVFMTAQPKGTPPALTFEDGLEVVELLMTAYLSAEQERTVAWKPEGLEHFVPAVARGAWRPV